MSWIGITVMVLTTACTRKINVVGMQPQNGLSRFNGHFGVGLIYFRNLSTGVEVVIVGIYMENYLITSLLFY